ncbi:hypothetical protein [Curtobacterium sp. MCSS17_016]|uniref:hypothetical protein n=1 Tax=Curtobacterium sp. MCSS17_016 TaxID=2175644 RepID=UPI000DA98917|nr:hypothetical protein [Curtobacterium sp. MCSS17_016]WIE81190.1 hypothetical protein DEJ19_018325 [Curtobacterium sp. MCSS17_016]
MTLLDDQAAPTLDAAQHVVNRVRRRQKAWFVATLSVVAALIAALLMAALGASNGTLPALHYAPQSGFTFGISEPKTAQKYDDGEVLLPGGGAVSCGVAYTETGKADGALSCDWSSYSEDDEVNTLLPNEFMKRHQIVSGKDAGQWCITAAGKGSTAGAPVLQVACGEQIDLF